MSDAAEARQPARLRPTSVLAGIALGFAGFNYLLFRLFAEPQPPDWLVTLLTGAWVFQPMLFAIWTALGPGWLVIKLPLVIACLMLAISAPGAHSEGFQDVERYEFIWIAVVGVAIFVVTAILLLLLRWFFCWRIELQHDPPNSVAHRLQFDIKYLIILITLCAVVLGVLINIKFSPPQPTLFLGPQFVIHFIVVGGSTMAAALLPVIAVPLMLLTPRFSKRAACWALVFWAVTTSVIVLFWLALAEENLLGPALVLQSGGAIAGSFVTLPLRMAGYRLNHLKQQQTMEISAQL